MDNLGEKIGGILVAVGLSGIIAFEGASCEARNRAIDRSLLGRDEVKVQETYKEEKEIYTWGTTGSILIGGIGGIIYGISNISKKEKKKDREK